MHIDAESWKAILTALGAAAILVVSEPFKWGFNSWVERRAVRKDAQKWPVHLTKSIKWIDASIEAVGKGRFPSTVHLQKMKIPEDAAIFSETYSKHLLPRASDYLHETRLLARNLNLDVDASMRAIEARSSNAGTMLRYLKARTIFLAHAMPYAIDGQEIPPCPAAEPPFLLLDDSGEEATSK